MPGKRTVAENLEDFRQALSLPKTEEEQVVLDWGTRTLHNHSRMPLLKSAMFAKAYGMGSANLAATAKGNKRGYMTEFAPTLQSLSLDVGTTESYTEMQIYKQFEEREKQRLYDTTLLKLEPVDYKPIMDDIRAASDLLAASNSPAPVKGDGLPTALEGVLSWRDKLPIRTNQTGAGY
jgi:hypothetical protein